MGESLMVQSSLLPLPSVNINIREGTMEDVPFLDSLQKMHTKQVGWMPTRQFEGKVKLGHVLVAWAPRPCASSTGEAPVPREERVGYLIGNDQYFKRDDVGIIYQLNVAPVHQRGLIGATLLKAQFERSAYGCKLYCCWCAQDIAANHFWEAMGFVPLAFRAGSEKKARVHIFWQKRIRSGDVTTPWWFPSKTNSGSIREDRIVLPIPPGTHWSDAKPMILPTADCQLPIEQAKQLPTATRRSPAKSKDPKLQMPTAWKARFAAPGAMPVEPPVKEKPKREKRPRAKSDPKLVAAARELRDRYLERVNENPSSLEAIGKYDVARAIGVDEGRGLRDEGQARPPAQRLLAA